jgi:hypothetical protein
LPNRMGLRARDTSSVGLESRSKGNLDVVAKDCAHKRRTHRIEKQIDDRVFPEAADKALKKDACLNIRYLKFKSVIR